MLVLLFVFGLMRFGVVDVILIASRVFGPGLLLVLYGLMCFAVGWVIVSLVLRVYSLWLCGVWGVGLCC